MKRLFAFDVDDTLIPRGETSIPSKEIDAINIRLDLGDALALASGRPFASLARYLASFTSGETERVTSLFNTLETVAIETLHAFEISFNPAITFLT